MITQPHSIVIAIDSPEAEEFVSWLNEQGLEASIGTDTGSWVDGQNTDNDPEASQLINGLWENYCNR